MTENSVIHIDLRPSVHLHQAPHRRPSETVTAQPHLSAHGCDPLLVIVRGLPGSGKTTLSRQIARSCGYLHVENDMFFETPTGYRFDRSQLTAAQQWCYRAARDALVAGQKVVVSNTFVRTAHMADFLALTDSVSVIECTGDYGSVHPLPMEIIASMRDRWEPFPGALRI
jgi:AAA domain